MEKAKRKGNPQKAHRRFALMLIGFIVFTMSISLLMSLVEFYLNIAFPLIVFQAPFTKLTPILYLIASLLWLFLTTKHYHIYGFSKWYWLLIIMCVLSAIFMAWFQYAMFSHNSWCYPIFDTVPFTPFAIYKGQYCGWVLF